MSSKRSIRRSGDEDPAGHERVLDDLGLGVGVADGYATLGAIGFEGRWDYGAIGTVTNLAAC